jgi:hypothetical protein
MRYIYSDESVFSDPRPCVGVGMLTVDREILPSVIAEALNALDNDPDRFIEPGKAYDDSTLRRKYFHACDDSKNAHSHLCDSINKNIDGEFISDFFDRSNLDTFEHGLDYLYDKATSLSSLKALQCRDQVSFVFEKRDGLSAAKIKDILKELESNVLMSIYDMPYAPHYSPNIEILLVDKLNPGIQCVDFILWALNRYVNNDKVWFKRIKSKYTFGFNTAKGDWGGQHTNVGKGVVEPKTYYNVEDFPIDPDSIINREMLYSFYLTVAKTVEYYHNNPVRSIMHLSNQIKHSVENKLNISDAKYFENLASIYIKLFDMVDVISKDTTLQQKQYLLLSKKYMSLLLRNDLIHGVQTRDCLNRVRRHYIKHNPQILKF